jgi:pilus assembly protein CpaE
MRPDNLLAEEPATFAAPDGQIGRSPFLAFVCDDASEAALSGGLAQLLAQPDIRRGGVRAAIRALEREESPRLLLVDVSGESDPLEALEALAQVCAPDARVVVLGDRNDVDVYRGITRDLGAAEYLQTPLTRDRVLSLLSPLLTGSEVAAQHQRGGRITVVCGAKGGAGATTIAVNLALQLSATTHGHVALLDLHLRGGHAAMLLGVQAGAGLRTALENPQRIDALFLDRITVPLGDRLRLVAADEPLDTEPSPSAAGVSKLLDLMSRRFNNIVVDLPMPPREAERQVLALARHALVVFGPDLGGLRDAEAAKQLIGQLAGPGRTLTVLNRANMAGGLEAGLIREGLGGPPDCIIPDLPKPMARAMNRGVPAVDSSAPYRRALAPLTQEISGGASKRRRGFFRRIFVR